MTPAEQHPDGFESQLRDALRAGPGSSAPRGDEELLRSVHHRAARRRTRRRVAGASVVVAGVAGAAVIVPQLPDATVPTASTPEAFTPSTPSRTSPSTASALSTAAATDAGATSSLSPATDPTLVPGHPVRPEDVDVESVTAVRDEQFWVLGTGQCPEGRCRVVAHTIDAGETFEFRAGPDPVAPSTDPTPGGLVGSDPGTDLRSAVNGRDAWGYDGEVWATHDAGRSWVPVTMPVPATITSIQAWGDTVWAFGVAAADGTPVVFSAPVGEDLWTSAELGLTSTDRLDVPVVADGVVGVLMTHADGEQAYVRSVDGGATWDVVPAPSGCDTPLSSSGVERALWLHCVSGEQALVAVSTDAGTTWAEQEVPLPQSTLTTMTGIDATEALVTDTTSVWIVSMGAGTEPVSGPFAAADDVWDGSGYTYAGFTDPATGYLVTSGGELARSEDGGRTWTPVDLP